MPKNSGGGSMKVFFEVAHYLGGWVEVGEGSLCGRRAYARILYALASAGQRIVGIRSGHDSD
jgi:hypothetical protein